MILAEDLMLSPEAGGSLNPQTIKWILLTVIIPDFDYA